MKTIKPVDIIIPTFNNPQMLAQCIQSMTQTRSVFPLRIIVVNNGHRQSIAHIPETDYIKIIHAEENLGWEGGLKRGLQESDAEYVMFANDDILIPHGSKNWLRSMLECFRDLKVGAVGPCSNYVTGKQNMTALSPISQLEVGYLIGFCILLKRAALDKVGGVDDSLPGGDDFDLSIRLTSAGYKLVCNNDVFVFHYGSVTGIKTRGDATNKGGWNSPTMIENTNMALIKKHGFAAWYGCLTTRAADMNAYLTDDIEGDIIRKHQVLGKTVELGCGGVKTVPHAIGVDLIELGKVHSIAEQSSVADIQCDVSNKLPFEDNSVKWLIARHILEHCIDPLKTLDEWKRVLHPKGLLAVAVPDETALSSIPLNAEHLHAFTPDSLNTLLFRAGFRMSSALLLGAAQTNGISIIAICEKGEN